MGNGAERIPATEFLDEVLAVEEEIRNFISKL